MNIRKKPRFSRTWKKTGFTIRVLALQDYDNDHFSVRDICQSLFLAANAGMRRFVPLDETTRSLFPKPGIEVQVSVEPGRDWEEVAVAARTELVRIIRRWARKLEWVLSDPRTPGEPTTHHHQSAPVDWERIADVVCQILVAVYRTHPNLFESEAARLGDTVEQCTANTITLMVRELIEGLDAASGSSTTLSPLQGDSL